MGVHGTCGLNNPSLGTGPAEDVITGLEFLLDLLGQQDEKKHVLENKKWDEPAD